MSSARWTVLLAVALLAPVDPARAQLWILRNRAYYEPLIAETHAAQINLLFPAISNAFPYSREPGRRIVWNIDLGKETPLFGWESTIASTHDLPPRAFGIGLWLPVDFHMVEDLNKDPSSPIIDTDYRFSLMLKAQYGMPAGSRLCLGAGSCRLGMRLQAGHESTHLGDEFSLAARLGDPTFERINVSYEYWEAAPSLDLDIGEAELALRVGLIGLWNPNNGWYSFNVAETNGRAVTLSHNDHEWYGGAQLMWEDRWTSGPLKWLFRRNVGWFLSGHARHRNVYDYSRASRDVPEDRRWSFNVMAGLRPTRRFLEKGVSDVYLRYYRGVNPFGQFRSQRDYQLFGFGIHIDN